MGLGAASPSLTVWFNIKPLTLRSGPATPLPGSRYIQIRGENRVKKADILVGTLIFFISASVFVMTQQFVGKVYTGYGPDRFPRFLAVIWSILGLMLIINALRNKYLEEDMKITLFGLIRVSAILAFTIAALIAMNQIGFIPATMIYIFGVMSYLKEKSWVGRIITAVAVTMGVYLLFKFVMVIPLPEFTLFET
jgi:hypothetical protein